MRAMAQVIRKQLKARDIPRDWDVHIDDGPETLVTVVIVAGQRVSGRPLASFIGAGQGVYESPEAADRYICASRDAWED